MTSADVSLGDCIVRPQRRIVQRGGDSIHVKPKAMAVFECLLAANGEPVSRNDLFDAVWPGGEVSDDTLTKCVVELRKAFGDTARESRVIETIPKLGFRLVLPVVPLGAAPLPEDRSSTEIQQPHPGGRRKLRPAWLLLVTLVIVFAALLTFDRSRLWLTEAGVTSFLKAAAIFVPYSLERKPGIAVLPFENMSGDAENDYFSDGMSAEVINALASTNRLPVTARNSSFQFKDQNRDIKEIGRLLGVTHVLEGSVRKADGSIRVTTQLIDTATGKHIWSGAYQRELSAVFELQNEIAQSIVEQIALALGAEIVPPQSTLAAAASTTPRRTENLEAYDLYLKGMQMLKSNNPGPIEQAAGYFDAAIALDDEYADAWAAKGLSLYVLGRPGTGHPHIPASVYPDAIAAFRRALKIEPGHALATGWLGVTLICNDYEWAEGLRLMEQALARNTNDAELLSVYGLHLGMMHMEGAEEVLDRAFRLDPFGTIPTGVRAGLLAEEGRVGLAAALIETSFLKDRDGYVPNYNAALYNLRIGRLDAAEEHIRKARQVAHPIDLSLEMLEVAADYLRGRGPMTPTAEVRERMQTERVSYVLEREKAIEWDDAEAVVDAYDIAIEQRHPEVRWYLFRPKPALMPEADWRRILEVTGVTQFQEARSLANQ